MSASVGNDVYAKLNKRLLESDEEDYKTWETFTDKNPDLKRHVLKIISDSEARDKKWRNLTREWEIDQGDDYDIGYMYTRTIELAEAYNHNQPKYHATGFGSYARKDKYTEMMRLKRLWENLFFGIYPELEPFLHRQSFRKQIISNEVRGSINWHQTILEASKTGGTPLEFVCQIPEISLDLPENRLLLLAVNWLHNDSESLLYYSGFPAFLEKEKSEVERVFNISEKILETNPLAEIQNKVQTLSRNDLDDDRVSNLVQKVKERIDNGTIQNRSYEELLQWVLEYRFFNVERFAGIPEGMRLDVKEDVDTMYEYWNLYEFTAYLENEKKISARIVNAYKKELTFELKNGTKRIKLVFDTEISDTQVRDKVRPDYVIRTLQNKIPFVMDAKNYLKENWGKAVMAVESYLVELNSLGIKDAVLFFPKLEKREPYSEHGITIHGMNYSCNNCNQISHGIQNEQECPHCHSHNIEHKPIWFIHSCITNPSDNAGKQKMMRENFGKIYEKMLKPLLE